MLTRVAAGAVGVLLVAGALVATVPAGAQEPTCQGRVVTIRATADHMIVEGTEGPDVIDGGDWNGLTINGRGGDDVICSGPNAQVRVYGGPGDDSVQGAAGTTLLFGGTDGVAISVPAGTADGEGHDTFTGITSFVGSPGPDTFVGGPARDAFVGNLGRYDATAAPDVADGGDGEDYLEATGTLRGGAGEDTLVLNGRGAVWGGDGDDTIWSFRAERASAYGVRLMGEAGSDIIEVDVRNGRRCDPRRCHDVIDGGDDRGDLLRVSMATRGLRLDVGTGRGRYGRVGATVRGIESVKGSMYDDVIVGDAGANRLRGMSGDDLLRGGGGSDHLIGGRGRDTADGGPGRDRCQAEVRRSC